MSSVVISGNTSGAITLSAPDVSGTNTATLPAATGTVMVSGNMPAFSANQSANQSIATGTYTKIQFNTENFDTNSNYDNATNYRFTPTVAGYYQINAQLRDATGATTSAAGTLLCDLYKNGVEFQVARNSFNGAGLTSNLSVLMYFNGTTDYVEIYGFQNSGVAMNIGSGVNTYFNGSMVRAA